MYGGTTRGRLFALALTVAVLGVGTACQEEDADPGRARESAAPSADDLGSLEDQAAAYETWEPVYGEVRPATADDVDSLRQRVVDLDARPYTVTVPMFGFEIASGPDHVRVRFGEGGAGGFDVHLDPTATSDALFEGFVICSAEDDSCVEVGEDRPEGGGPHLFNNGIDTLLFYAASIVDGQLELPDELGKADEGSITTVESPSGTLDCLLTGSTPERRERLAGKPVDLMADPFSRVGGPDPLRTVCLDESGLAVVTLPSLVAGVVAYESFTTGVPDGFDEHPEPVPYGTSPSASPSESPTAAPASPGTDPDAIHYVLVASDTIPAGESVSDAQMNGRFELDAVPGREVVPGAVDSTDGLAGVALEDIAEGTQITAASFG